MSSSDATAPQWADDPARYRIWWTTGEQARLADVLARRRPGLLHPDLMAALASRVGRCGRCRLWPAGGIPAGEVAWPEDPADPIGYHLESADCGGIVFHQALLDQARRMPGVVTTMALELA